MDVCECIKCGTTCKLNDEDSKCVCGMWFLSDLNNLIKSFDAKTKSKDLSEDFQYSDCYKDIRSDNGLRNF